MTETYPFKPGDWVMAENDFARVESIFPMHYEAFDINADEDVEVGDYDQTVISYHSFCNVRGKVNSSKAQIKYFDFCDWIKPLIKEQTVILERIKEKKAKAFSEWEAKCKDAKDYVAIYVEVKKGYADAVLPKFRKAAKNLPKRFTFTDVQKILRSIPEIKADTASTESLNEDYIYFELCYILKEQSGSHLSFYWIREFASSTDMSTFINFEGVFISLYQLVKLYNQTNPSERLNHFADKLKEAASALFNHDFKNSPLAKDFFKNAPKIFYTFDTAYSTMSDFLMHLAKDFDVEDFAELVKSQNEDIIKLYHKILGV